MLHQDLVLKHNELYLVGDSHGDGSGERATGLYARDTRFLDCWNLRLNGQPLEPLDARVLGPDRALVVSANEALEIERNGQREAIRPLAVSVEQHVRLDAELHVRIVLGNFSGQTLPLTLSLELGGDFRDIFDIRGFPRAHSGGTYLPPIWTRGNLAFGYTDRTGATARLRVSFSRTPAVVVPDVAREPRDHEQAVLLPQFTLAPAPRHASAERELAAPRDTASFSCTLAPGESWDLVVALSPVPAGGPCITSTEAAEARMHDAAVARLFTGQPDLDRILHRAAADLEMLQTSFPHGRLTAAGIPWYVAPFGRDSLIVALQTLHLSPGRGAETLRTLAALQGREIDPFREEEPGKILHEMRYGEMARLGEIPHTPYFGSVDATPLFVMLFAELVRWTGDETLYRELLPHVKRALTWIEEWGDRDGDALVEYSTRPVDGAHIVHQGWKDSHDSLNCADGQPVSGTIALVEVQGYVYAAYGWLADAAALFGDAAWASELRERAQRVQRSVEAQFWLPEAGYYAQALDTEKNPVDAIASNPGHLLYCGLPSPERARLVAERLRQPDLGSGWGVRTLATGMVTYNPMSYHNGSIWPHDNSLIAAGLARYGERMGLARIAQAIFAAASHFPDQRLPELYCGFPRNASAAEDAPVHYPVSCSPQAWAAGAVPLLMREMLGLAADPRQGVVRLSPALPDWLPRVRIEGMSALGRRFDLTVERDGAGYVVTSDGPVDLVPRADSMTDWRKPRVPSARSSGT